MRGGAIPLPLHPQRQFDRGIGVERLRDPPTEWNRQFDALGLNPE
jgi:hypothetical protein